MTAGSVLPAGQPRIEVTACRTAWSMIDDGDLGGDAIRGAFRA
jgi:hypothetical protein